MFKHEKELFHPVAVERPNSSVRGSDSRTARRWKWGTESGEQYMSQSFRIKDAEIKDLFLDIAAKNWDIWRWSPRQ